MCDAVGRKCVDYRVHRGGDGGHLAAPFDPDRVVPATGTLRRHCDRRQVIRARHAVIHKRACEKLTTDWVINAMLAQRLAGALHDAAMDLAFDDHRVKHDPDIVDCGVGDERKLAKDCARYDKLRC